MVGIVTSHKLPHCYPNEGTFLVFFLEFQRIEWYFCGLPCRPSTTRMGSFSKDLMEWLTPPKSPCVIGELMAGENRHTLFSPKTIVPKELKKKKINKNKPFLSSLTLLSTMKKKTCLDDWYHWENHVCGSCATIESCWAIRSDSDVDVAPRLYRFDSL